MQTAIAGFLRYLRIERNSSPLTLKSYGADLADLLEFFRSSEDRLPAPANISIGQLRAFVADLHQRGYARSTVARRLASLRSFFEYCRREKLVESNPARALRTPRQGRRLPHFLNTKQVAALLETPSKDQPAGLRDRAILETLYSAGLRVSELVAMNLDDWDRDGNIVRVRGKGRKERIAPIGRFAAASLSNWLEVRRPASDITPAEQDAVFLNRFGRRLTARSVGRLLEKH
ncbi:tyrosine-type recombinase/integrase, partial [Planctomycetaceae bacterium]|nr:tyrosine-type recombinase/integrase [Planctomycetaceae bacterium]